MTVSVFMDLLGGCESFFDAPPFSYSRANGATVKTESFSPFTTRESFSAKGYELVGPSIFTVLFTCCPPAIFRSVVSIVVDAVNLMRARWLFAHIFNKRLERVSPRFANGYTSLPIVFKTWVFGVIASCYYGVPCLIKRVISNSHKRVTTILFKKFQHNEIITRRRL